MVMNRDFDHPSVGFVVDDTRDARMEYSDDSLFLQNSYHLGMSLVILMLTGNNYLTWSHSIKIALGAKVELGFINRKCIFTSEDSLGYEQWVYVDCLVASSISHC